MRDAPFFSDLVAWACLRLCDVKCQYLVSCKRCFSELVKSRELNQNAHSQVLTCIPITATLNLMFSATFTFAFTFKKKQTSACGRTKFSKRLSPEVPAVIIWTVTATWRRRGAAGIWCSHIKWTWTRLPLSSPSASLIAWLFIPCCMWCSLQRCPSVLWFRPSLC